MQSLDDLQLRHVQALEVLSTEIRMKDDVIKLGQLRLPIERCFRFDGEVAAQEQNFIKIFFFYFI